MNILTILSRYKEKERTILKLKKENQQLRERKKLPSLEHNNLLDIVFQIESFKKDLKTFEESLKKRQMIIDNKSDFILTNYPIIKKYMQNLKENGEGSLRTIY